jgi:Phage integrase, N-terminal SAM-like domain
MNLRMPRPMKRKGSSVHQFRRRIPADLIGRTAGVTLGIPLGDRTVTKSLSADAKEVVVSLRTHDPAEAKRRQATALAYLEGVWGAIRNGRRRISHKQIVALAGEIYRDLVSGLEDNPGSVRRWQKVLDADVAAQAGVIERWPLPIGQPIFDRRAAMEQRFGPSTDLILARHGLVVDEETRWELLQQVAKALSNAAFRLWQNAEGDYSPDPEAEKFPAFEDAAKPPVSLKGLVDGWWREAKIANRSPSTHEAYRNAAAKLTAFLGHDNADRVTTEDVIRFKDGRLSEGISLKTIRDSDLASLKAIFKWGVQNRLLKENPAAP